MWLIIHEKNEPICLGITRKPFCERLPNSEGVLYHTTISHGLVYCYWYQGFRLSWNYINILTAHIYSLNGQTSHQWLCNLGTSQFQWSRKKRNFLMVRYKALYYSWLLSYNAKDSEFRPIPGHQQQRLLGFSSVLLAGVGMEEWRSPVEGFSVYMM